MHRLSRFVRSSGPTFASCLPRVNLKKPRVLISRNLHRSSPSREEKTLWGHCTPCGRLGTESRFHLMDPGSIVTLVSQLRTPSPLSVQPAALVGDPPLLTPCSRPKDRIYHKCVLALARQINLHHFVRVKVGNEQQP